MNKKVRLEQNYWAIRELFEDKFIEDWYDWNDLDEVTHGRDDFVEKERKLYKELYLEDM